MHGNDDVRVDLTTAVAIMYEVTAHTGQSLMKNFLYPPIQAWYITPFASYKICIDALICHFHDNFPNTVTNWPSW